MRNLTDALLSYVPQRVVDRLVAGEVCAPFVEHFPAAVLFADVSGSTALAERLATSGPAGAEEFSRLLNAYLGPLIDVVTEHGGDVVKFAGDGLFAVWPASPRDSLAIATRRAAHCALAVQATLRERACSEGTGLSMGIGVGAGEVTGMAVGSPDARMEYLIAGTPVMETCRAESATRAGESMLTAGACALLNGECTGVPLPDGALRLDSVRAPEHHASAHTLPSGGEFEASLRPYAPAMIVERLAAGHDEWLAELRRVTVLFMRVPEYSAATLAAAQELTRLIQGVLARYGGTFARIGVDEHGPAVNVAFGVPPLTYEDDAVRAVLAALELHSVLRARHHQTAIGIATGRMFCGAVGSRLRREYTTVGDAANVAARLMQAADDEILCDAATIEASDERVACDALTPILVKGKAEPVAIFRPHRARGETVRPRPDLVGRVDERAQLRQRLHVLIDSRNGGIVLIEGEAGIGKSRLATDLCEQAHALEVATLVGAGDAIEVSTPYHAWRSILSRYFRLDELADDRAVRRAHVQATLEAAWPGEEGAALRSLSPLLNAVLSLDLPDSDLTAQMSDEARADNTRDLLVQLLERAVRACPLLLLIEDAHWLDSASWAVARRVGQQVRGLLLVIVTRPLSEPLPPEYRQLLQLPDTQRLALDVLPRQEALDLVAQRLGVQRLAEDVAAFVHERAGGHPFFSEELIYALRDAHRLAIVDGEGRLAFHAHDLHALHLPDTLEGVITSRVDRLAPRLQLVLKVASVLGRSFTLSTLRDLHPIEMDRLCVPDDLDALAQLDLLRREGGAEPSYLFKHAITQEVAYALLSFAQRRQLHQRVADWYVQTYAADLAPFYALLAHHSVRAVNVEQPETPLLERAIDASERAGEQALRSHAHREAARFLHDAVRMLALAPARSPAADQRRARWERQLGEAYFRLGRAPLAREHLCTALTLLRQPVPSTGRRGHVRLAIETLRQASRRLLPSSLVEPARQTPLLEAARAYEVLGFVLFLLQDYLPSMFATVRALNLAEQVDPDPAAVYSAATVGLYAGILVGGGLAERYFRLGFDIAGRLGDADGFGRVTHMKGFYLIGEARWEEAEAVLRQSFTAMQNSGDTRWREMALFALGNLRQMHRRYADSLPFYEEATRTSFKRGDVQAQAWCSVGAGGALNGLGRTDDALKMYDAMEASLADNVEHLSDRGSEFSVCGIRALAHFRRGNFEQARVFAERASRISEQSALLIYYALPGYTNVAEVFVRLWERNIGAAEETESALSATRAVAALRHFAKYFPIAQPQASLWRGVAYWLRGRRRKARAAWHRSCAIAERLDMSHDEGLAHYEIARHLPSTDAARAQHLWRACELFRLAGVTYELEYAAAELSGTPVVMTDPPPRPVSARSVA